jgi:uncharacterized membrane protein YdbT with pleckstrin-like domain
MSYIEKYLMDSENIIYRTKRHWIVFIWPTLWLVLAIVILTVGSGVSTSLPFFYFFGLIAVLTGLAAYITYSTSEFGVTNMRVIVKVGFIRRNTIEILLSKVESIEVKQGILGRMFGYGTIFVSGTGGTKDPFHKITNPLEFRRKTQEQIMTVQPSS